MQIYTNGFGWYLLCWPSKDNNKKRCPPSPPPLPSEQRIKEMCVCVCVSSHEGKRKGNQCKNKRATERKNEREKKEDLSPSLLVWTSVRAMLLCVFLCDAPMMTLAMAMAMNEMTIWLRINCERAEMYWKINDWIIATENGVKNNYTLTIQTA